MKVRQKVSAEVYAHHHQRNNHIHGSHRLIRLISLSGLDPPRVERTVMQRKIQSLVEEAKDQPAFPRTHSLVLS
jgi:hypothetical protein